MAAPARPQSTQLEGPSASAAPSFRRSRLTPHVENDFELRWTKTVLALLVCPPVWIGQLFYREKNREQFLDRSEGGGAGRGGGRRRTRRQKTGAGGALHLHCVAPARRLRHRQEAACGARCRQPLSLGLPEPAKNEEVRLAERLTKYWFFWSEGGGTLIVLELTPRWRSRSRCCRRRMMPLCF
jgi:hypothetical protein